MEDYQSEKIRGKAARAVAAEHSTAIVDNFVDKAGKNLKKRSNECVDETNYPESSK